MNQLHKQRLFAIVFILLCLSSALAIVLYTLKQNINLFFTLTQVSEGKAPAHHRFRMGGWVEKGSVVHAQHDLGVKFVLSDHVHHMTVVYQGILPTLFRENQAVVVSGQIVRGKFVANEVLAKHDERYVPPEMRDHAS